uniref:Uncharacterized protein n=1 Tax=Oryza rufipogon TaxID=4529 RepID=A0A0G2KBQ8_ORYRU
MMTTVVADGR